MFMAFVEKIAFRLIDAAVCVTNQMELYYRSKYPNTKIKYIYLPIFTSNVCQQADIQSLNELKLRLDMPENAVVYLYSGGLQAWQNIDLMLTTTAALIKSPENWFIFLTAEGDALAAKVKDKFGYAPEKILITYAKPTELRSYYELANFGFVLREDHILNRVANPTKLVEYLYFGIIPIVWTEKIGDFVEMNYEYLTIRDLLGSENRFFKSDRNRLIVLSLLNQIKSINIISYLK